MNIQKITIRNILGIEHLEIEPGALTVVEGRNGAGKTSVLEAIKSVVAGGHDATLLRRGQETGEVVLLLEDGVELRKRVTEKSSGLTVRHPEQGTIGKPQGYVDALTDALSVNPIAFLTAPAKKRAEYLLESAPLRIEAGSDVEARLQEMLKNTYRAGIALDGHALEVLAQVHRAIYDERTGLNRAAKEKRATAEQLRASLPDEVRPAETLAAEVAALRAQRDEVHRSYAEEVREIDTAESARVEAIKERARQEIEVVRAEVAVRRHAVTERSANAGSELGQKLAEAEALLKESERHQNTSALLERTAGSATELEAGAANCTAALDELEEIKADILARLPFKGIEIKDGEIYAHGIAFDRLNRAEQVKLAINVARLRAGELGLICVDGLECLDPETFEAFCERAAKDRLQLVVTRVTDGAFNVQTAGAA